MHNFNLGEGKHNYRVPDGGIHRHCPSGVWHATAALAVEIVSPGDETWEKLPFYVAHGVDEVLIVDPDTRRIEWLALLECAYVPVERSRLMDLATTTLATGIDWPS